MQSKDLGRLVLTILPVVMTDFQWNIQVALVNPHHCERHYNCVHGPCAAPLSILSVALMQTFTHIRKFCV